MGRPSDRTLLRRFTWITLAVAVAGFAIALYADRPSEERLAYADAWREIGGALVSGAIVAGLVLWFEERREEERTRRQETRDDQAAIRAWRREVDIKLFSLVLSDLAITRQQWILALKGRPTYGGSGLMSSSIQAVTAPMFEDLAAHVREVRTLLGVLREQELDDVCGVWLVSMVKTQSTIGKVLAAEADEAFAVRSTHSFSDQDFRTMEEEERNFERLTAVIEAYRDKNYPVSY